LVQEVPSLQERIDASCAVGAVLEGSHAAVPDGMMDTFWRLRYWPIPLQEELEGAQQRLHAARNQHQLQLKQDQQDLLQELEDLRVRVQDSILHATALHMQVAIDGQQQDCWCMPSFL
jgi:hypothetical protein